MGKQRLDDCRQRISEDARQISFTRHGDGKGQLLYWRSKPRSNIGSIATRIDAVPAVHGQINGIQAMEREGG